MPGPMPPQGGAPGAPPSGPPQAGGSPHAASFLDALDQGIDGLAQNIMSDKSAPPEAKQLAQQIDQMFGKLMDMIKGGGGEAPPGGDGQGQTVPMEAGGNKGAIPAP